MSQRRRVKSRHLLRLVFLEKVHCTSCTDSVTVHFTATDHSSNRAMMTLNLYFLFRMIGGAVRTTVLSRLDLIF